MQLLRIPKCKLDAFELTCDELSPIPKVEPVVAEAVASIASLKLGTKLKSVAGTIYTVVGYDTEKVQVSLQLHIPTCTGKFDAVPARLYIPIEASQGQLSMKDFEIVE